jgi:hypothetical protein
MCFLPKATNRPAAAHHLPTLKKGFGSVICSCPQRLKILEIHKLVSLMENSYENKIILQKRQKYPQ